MLELPDVKSKILNSTTTLSFAIFCQVLLLMPAFMFNNDTFAQSNGVQNITDKATNIVNTTSNSFVTVSIVKYASNPYNPKFYDPSPVNVKTGTTIAWINNDPTIHTVTERKGNNNNNYTSAIEFDSGMLAPNAIFKHTFNTAGTFDYYCLVHPFMTGKVIVAAK